jgi:hypothetical protein
VEEEKADGRRRHRIVLAGSILVSTVLVVRIDAGAAADAAANAVACDTEDPPRPLQDNRRLYNTIEDSNCIHIVMRVVVDEETLEVMEAPME